MMNINAGNTCSFSFENALKSGIKALRLSVDFAWAVEFNYEKMPHLAISSDS